MEIDVELLGGVTISSLLKQEGVGPRIQLLIEEEIDCADWFQSWRRDVGVRPKKNITRKTMH